MLQHEVCDTQVVQSAYAVLNLKLPSSAHALPLLLLALACLLKQGDLITCQDGRYRTPSC